MTDPGGLGPALLYDARDLTTHAVAVGMTGSGKTGLCLSILEEAALDGIPAIAIDPKGDLGNLLLTFPDLAAGDFRPWIDEARAERDGIDPDALARREAAKWRQGLAEWGQDGARIAALREAADFAIYTPGAGHGLPLAVLRSLTAPGAALLDDPDALQQRVSSTVSAVLALAGVEADPLHSREHILLSHIVDSAWRDGRDLELAGIIRSVQDPGFERVGVLELDSFYPEKERFELAMQLNNLLAAPGFQAWMDGEQLDMRRLLWTRDGQPRVSILSIAHLSEPERMFFVTVVLNELLAWIRTRPGTSSLRAILYVDEVLGYLPPTRMPPSKPPLLTLLKQARAFGLGVVLATQNPVDLDYKALSNAGTWFLGRLQTERDKARVLDGLEGAAAFGNRNLDRGEIDRVLAGLDSRVFLLNNVHEDGPVLFRTRWAMSYLRGPLARPEIRRLMEPRREAPRSETAAGAPVEEVSAPTPGPTRAERPVVPPGIEEVFLARPTGEGSGSMYRPALLGEADLHYSRTALGVDEWRRVVCLAPLDEEVMPDPWRDSRVSEEPLRLVPSPDPLIGFAPLPARAAQRSSYRSWSSALKGHLYRERPLHMWRCRAPKLASEVGESQADFRIRVREAVREIRDEALDKLRKRYAAKLVRLDAAIGRAEERVERETSQYSQQKMQTAISVGATVLDALIGRKKVSRGSVGRATTAMRGAGRASRERDDVRRAEENLAAARARREEMDRELQREVDELRAIYSVDAAELEEVRVAPRKSDIAVHRLTLAWIPMPDGD